MVTPSGFNALLKIVEEPPEHVKFIFATTEPEKVIGTIRSRTHHYPFRLVPPAQLLEYVHELADSEGVADRRRACCPSSCAPAAVPCATRLSLLDQLIAGSDADTVTYERAVALLGYTHAALLDDVVDAIAAADSAAAFGGDRPRRADRAGSPAVRRRPARAAARPHRRAGHGSAGGERAARRARRRSGPHARAVVALRARRPLDRRRRGQPRPHRDDRRHLAPSAPRAHDGPRARHGGARRRRGSTRRRRCGRRGSRRAGPRIGIRPPRQRAGRGRVDGGGPRCR